MAHAPQNALDLEGVTKRYAPPPAQNAVDGIDLHVPFGEIFGLLGPNGAGKTTTVGIATTRVRPTAGRVRVAGVDAVADPAGAKQHIGVVTQFNTLDRACSVAENLYFHGRFFGLSGRDARARCAFLLDAFELDERRDAMVPQLSGGLARRVQLACALVHRPEILFLDEPTTGLDPQSRIALWEAVERMRDHEGMTVVLTTHYIEEADRLCSRVAIMDRGRILVCDEPDAIKRDAGSATVVTLRLSEPDPAVTARIAALPGVRSADGDGVLVRVNVADQDGTVPHVVAAAGDRLKDVAVERPSLETAFIALTGRGLRE
jgi:ABC-2 type transport system ATP-binding protein